MMKTIAKAGLAVALLAGCGGTDLRSTGGADDQPQLGGETEIGTSQQQVTADLRMRAINTEGFASLQLVANDVKVLADGVAVPVQLAGDLVDLTNQGHAEKLGTFSVPADAQVIEFVVELGAAGGFDDGSASGWIDARQTELRFQSTVEQLAAGKATLVLDMSKSLAGYAADTLVMVPKYRVWF